MSEADRTPVVIGIDAGGTHTRGVAVDAGGVVIARAAREGGNPRTTGDARGRAEIRAAVSELRAAAPGPVAHLVLGSAGLLDAATSAERDRWSRELGFPDPTVDSDARIAHAAAFGAGPGVMVVAGTGSQCLAFGAAGERVRVGGWGPTFGDEGSAYRIAVSAVRVALQAMDEDRDSALLDALLDFAGVTGGASGRAREHALLDVLYDPAAGPATHARFAPVVTDLADAGDPEATAILQRAGATLAAMATLAARRSGERRVSFSGSVLDASQHVRDTFHATARDAGLSAAPRRWEPVLGAAYLAMTTVGWDAEAAGARWEHEMGALATG